MFSFMLISTSLGIAGLEVAIILLSALLLGFILSYELTETQKKSANHESLSVFNPQTHRVHPDYIIDAYVDEAADTQGTPPIQLTLEDEHDTPTAIEVKPHASLNKNGAINGHILSSIRGHDDLASSPFLTKMRQDIDKIREDIERQEDLTVIHGITDEVAELLAQEGIKSFEALSLYDTKTLKKQLKKHNLTGYYVSSWPRQAKLAQSQQWRTLKTFQHEMVLSQ